jgi:hypothetical protein
MHDLEDSRAAVKCDLAAAVIRSSGELRLKVTGSSMLPSIWPGDILTIRRQNLDQIGPGEIVLVARDGGLCAHRVLAKSGPLLTTRGDALPCADPPVPFDQVLGRVTSILRGRTRISPRPSVNIRHRLLSSLLRRSNTLTILLLRLHALRRQPWAAV